MKNGNRFNIDFFEFAFLTEACIPEVPIARSMFWDKVCDRYYQVLTPDERAKLFEWIQRNYSFKLEKEGCRLFYDRYNPENQYLVTTLYKGKEEVHECFRHKDRYHINKTTSIEPQYITSVSR